MSNMDLKTRLQELMENKMLILCATDVNTDMGRIAEENI